MLVIEVRRYDGLEDLSKKDLNKMHRIYLQMKEEINYIATVLIRDDVWDSFSAYEKLQLRRFYTDAVRLSEDIDSFIADPYNTDYLKAAAKISAYGSIVARIIFSVYKFNGTDLD
jgi:hypothetical protein